jgi:hypothetical protein
MPLNASHTVEYCLPQQPNALADCQGIRHENFFNKKVLYHPPDIDSLLSK